VNSYYDTINNQEGYTKVAPEVLCKEDEDSNGEEVHAKPDI
jgi:hypothetical protein